MSRPSDVLDYKHNIVEGIPTHLDEYAIALDAVRESQMSNRDKAYTPKEMADVIAALQYTTRHADAYYLPEDMQHSLEQASVNVPDDFVWHVELLPSDRGFLMCEKHYVVAPDDPTTQAADMRWFSWCTSEDYEWDTVFILYYASKAYPYMPLPCYMFKIANGEPIFQTPTHYELMPTVKFFAACFTFLQQQLVEALPIQADRATRKRLERTTQTTPISSTVQIVRLRHRYVPNAERDTPMAHDWNYSWMVRGHWRKQPYPSKGQGVYKHIFIRPYRKGPEDKPLRGTEKVYAIVR